MLFNALTTRSLRHDFEKTSGNRGEYWYDLIDDWDLIESSFTSQYGIRLRNEPDMSWDEFSTLLSGIMPETPLGQIVSIRSETDKDVIKNFNQNQKNIRSAWRSKMIANMSEAEMEAISKTIQQSFAEAYSKVN